MKKRIVITGATGLIGSAIAAKLIQRGDDVIVFSRSPESAKRKVENAHDYVKWDYNSTEGWSESIENSNAVIHLAGENVMARRWNSAHKERVLNSRVEGTNNLVNVIKTLKRPPEVFVCASAIGFYGNSIDLQVDEDSPPGNSFLSDVTKYWEEAAAKVEGYEVRRVSVRIGIVLDKNEGALSKMITPFKFFIGGSLGSGKQWVQWIHIEDIAEMFIYALDNNITGPINGVAPGPVRMKEFAESIGTILKRPSIFDVPEFVLRIILGEGAEAIIKGSQVVPKKTLEMGYKYKFEDINIALQDILSS